jgi:hypothetical protein
MFPSVIICQVAGSQEKHLRVSRIDANSIVPAEEARG